MALKGIDVSYAQGTINWSAVYADGVRFAMIKATQGRAVSSNSYLFTDRRFAANITGASDVGLKCGVYHYLTAETVKEAQTEAEHFCRTIEPYRARIDLWAAVDVEEKKYLPKNKKLLTEIVNAFTAYVAAEGWRPMIYTNRDFFQSYLNYGSLSHKTIWRAHWKSNGYLTYSDVDADSHPTDYAGDMPIWQFGMGKRGTVKGIGADIDLNYGYFDETMSKAPTVALPDNDGFAVGDRVKVRAGRNYLYGTIKKFTLWFREYEVISVKGDRVVIGKKGTVTAAVDAENLVRVD
jgi:GH25 family lysozyme M1 (1,4-beta-N-acetylmuramidase)